MSILLNVLSCIVVALIFALTIVLPLAASERNNRLQGSGGSTMHSGIGGGTLIAVVGIIPLAALPVAIHLHLM